MTRRITSPVMVGRASEMAVLEALLAEAGSTADDFVRRVRPDPSAFMR